MDLPPLAIKLGIQWEKRHKIYHLPLFDLKLIKKKKTVDTQQNPAAQ